jgi:hypothetical protein
VKIDVLEQFLGFYCHDLEYTCDISIVFNTYSTISSFIVVLYYELTRVGVSERTNLGKCCEYRFM